MAVIDPSPIKEKTFIFAKFAFAMAVDEKIPKTQSTLIDENLMIKMGIKPLRVMCQRFSYGGVQTRIVAEARFTAQTVLNGIQMGNSFLKVLVIRDLNHLYGVDAVAGGKLYTRLSGTKDDDSYLNISPHNSHKLPGKRKVHEIIDDAHASDLTAAAPPQSSRTSSLPSRPASRPGESPPPSRSRTSSCSSASTSSGTWQSIVVDPRSPQPTGRYIHTDVFDYADQQAIGDDDDDEVMDGQFYIEENTFSNDANQEIFDDDEQIWNNRSIIVENRFVSNPGDDYDPDDEKNNHESNRACMKPTFSHQEMKPRNKKKKSRFWTLATP